MIFLTMLIIPLLVALGFFIFSGKRITIGEFLLQNVAQICLMSTFLLFNGCQSTHDVEVWSGRVESKTRDEVSCSHSYKCFCYNSCSTDSKGHQSCTEICQTCYEHSYDVDWNVHTSIGTFDIDRVDRQGTSQPSRWTSTKIGEPVSTSRSFTNYVKASPDTLFRKQGLVEQFEGKLPEYPGKIYDYWHIDRLVSMGVTLSDQAEWNRQLHELNADLGPKKHANVSIVLVKNQPNEYFYALEQAWIGAKKNDFIVVINVDDTDKITWSQVMAWTDNKLAEVVVRDSINKIGVLNRKLILASIEQGVTDNFVKKPMEDFEYLKNVATPSTGAWIFSMIFGLIVSIGLGILFMNNGYDQDEEFYNIKNRGR